MVTLIRDSRINQHNTAAIIQRLEKAGFSQYVIRSCVREVMDVLRRPKP